jgi:hypothetical protein
MIFVVMGLRSFTGLTRCLRIFMLRISTNTENKPNSGDIQSTIPIALAVFSQQRLSFQIDWIVTARAFPAGSAPVCSRGFKE